MLSLSRGGPTVWMSPADAGAIDVAGQRLGRVRQRQRRPRLPGDRQPPDAGRRGLRPPRAGAHDRRAQVRGHRAPGWHPQLRDPAAGQADATSSAATPSCPTRSTISARPATSATWSRPSGGARQEVTVLMRVMAQMAMVMNLDKCIGCHTCSVTCKQAWTNRAGVEYVWFNNVETRPGQGYPRRYEDQETWRGGWTLNRRGRLQLKAGGRVKQAARHLREPGAARARRTTTSPGPTTTRRSSTRRSATTSRWPGRSRSSPARTPRSPGRPTGTTTSAAPARWATSTRSSRRCAASPRTRIRFELEQTFMFYLPRICEHCLNPSCMASCPSGAIYKRAEDGIVLVDQDRCRGWRQCVTGCPYKKIYFNHKTGKAEKCTFCYPRIEVGLPTVCSETCVGRLRYLGLVPLRRRPGHRGRVDARTSGDLYEAQLDLMLDPSDPGGRSPAARDRASPTTGWTRPGARRSTPGEDATASRCPCTRSTAPCRWSGTSRRCRRSSTCCASRDTTPRTASNLFGAIDALRIPVEYLAELFTAGDTDIVTGVLRKLAAMRVVHARHHARPGPRRVHPRVGRHDRRSDVRDVPADGDRQVRGPLRHPEGPRGAGARAGGARLLARLRRGPRHVRVRPVRRGLRPAGPRGRRDLPRPASSGRPPTAIAPAESLRGRVNLLNWDGNGAPDGLFPPRATERAPHEAPGRAPAASARRLPGRVAGASATPTARWSRLPAVRAAVG